MCDTFSATREKTQAGRPAADTKAGKTTVHRSARHHRQGEGGGQDYDVIDMTYEAEFRQQHHPMRF